MFRVLHHHTERTRNHVEPQAANVLAHRASEWSTVAAVRASPRSGRDCPWSSTARTDEGNGSMTTSETLHCVFEVALVRRSSTSVTVRGHAARDMAGPDSDLCICIVCKTKKTER